MSKNKIHIIKGDLSIDNLNKIISQDEYVSIDTETTGLNISNSDIKLIQISSKNEFYLLRIDRRKDYSNLKSLLSNNGIKKIFHNAIFDLRFLTKDFPEIKFENIICTKIAERILTESKEKTSLKFLVEKYKDIEMDKTERLSNWSSLNYSESQIRYAIDDVKYLKYIWSKQRKKLLRQKKYDLAIESFNFITSQIKLEKFNLDNVFKY